MAGWGLFAIPVSHVRLCTHCFGMDSYYFIGAVMHKVCNIVFAVLRDKKPFEIISPEEHKSHYKQHLSLAA